MIGGADGPTSVFVAGKVGDGFELGMVIGGGILVVEGIIIFLNIRRIVMINNKLRIAL